MPHSIKDRLENLGSQRPEDESFRLPHEGKILPAGVVDEVLQKRQEGILQDSDRRKSKIRY